MVASGRDRLGAAVTAGSTRRLLVTSRTDFRLGGGSASRTVSRADPLASRLGMTLIAPPGVATVVKPFIWSADSRRA